MTLGRRIRRLGLRAEQREALVRERVQAAQALLHRLEPEGGAAGDVDGVADLRLLDALHRAACFWSSCSCSTMRSVVPLALAAAVHRRARARRVTTSSASSRARASRTIAAIDCGLAGDLGLVPERLELAADLAGEVAQPGEVGLHRVELAEGLLFAAAVLEDAGGLLDEAAALLRAGAAAPRRAGPGRR